MISIDLGGYPTKGHRARLTAEAIDGRMVWELEVDEVTLGWHLRCPDLSRDGLTFEQALDLMWEADNGGAAELLRALGVAQETVDAAWRRQHNRFADGRVREPDQSTNEGTAP